MPALTGPLHSKALRLLVDGSDFSCLATDVSYTLDGGNVDATAFCHALKSMQYGIVDGKITLNLFYDAGYQGSHVKVLGALTQGAQLSFLVEGEGWKVNGQADGFRGIVNSVNPQRQVGNLQALQCEVQIQGELLIGRNLFNYQTDFLVGGGSPVLRVSRSRVAGLDDPKLNQSGTFNGYLFYHVFNDDTAGRAVTIATNVDATTTGQTVLLTTGTIPSGGFAAGLISGPLKSTIGIQNFVSVSVSALTGASSVISHQIVLVDPTVSFVAG